MKGIYVFLADGFEISEGLTTANILKRGGLEVETVSITDDFFVTSSNETTVLSDLVFEELPEEQGTAGPEDVMIFPGGLPGSENLAGHEALMELLKSHYEQGGTVAAICAAPGIVLSKLPVTGKKMTCYTGFEKALIEKGAIYTGNGVETDGQFITGKGPGLAVDFGLAILEKVAGKEKAAQIKAQLML